jgi:hypothetical protein
MAKVKPNINKIIFILFILITTNAVSQDIRKIEESDVVYLYFKETLYKQIHLRQVHEYGQFLFEFDKPYKLHHLTLYVDPHIRPFSLNIKKEKRSFLKKQKDLILNYDFLINVYGYDNAKKLLLNKKRIYIINQEDIRCFSIKLLEVKIFDTKNLVPIE